MKNRILLFTLILGSIALSAISYPKWPEVQSPPGAQWIWDNASSTWRPLAGDNTGNMSSSFGASTTLEVTMPSVGQATTSFVVLATNTVTLFQSVASFTSGDIVMFQGRGKFYWSIESSPAMTAAEMQLRAYVAEAGDSPIQVQLNTTANLALVADSASIATLTYSIMRLQ